jgi:tetratricopeptide (TPR) repeat protein
MGLKGNLRTMDLPEILQWISIGRKTGTLHLERASIEKRIVFRNGDIYTSWSNDPRESLAQYLIRHQRLSEEQLFETMSRGEEQGVPLGQVLISERLLGEADLRGLLERKVQDTIYDVFLWPEGAFEFVDGEIQEEVQIFLNLEVTSVVLEGARRLDEWKRIRQVIPSAQATFRRLGNAAKVAAKSPEAQALRLANAGKSVAEISLELRMSEFEASMLLFELIRTGTLAAEPVEEPDRASDPVGAIKELLALAQTHMAEKRFDQAVEAYEAVLSLDSLNQVAKKGRRAAESAHAKARATRTVPLDKVPVLTTPLSELTRMNIDPQEGFVLSRVNGQWDVRSILKLCPIPEEDALMIFARLLERSVIELR